MVAGLRKAGLGLSDEQDAALKDVTRKFLVADRVRLASQTEDSFTLGNLIEETEMTGKYGADLIAGLVIGYSLWARGRAGSAFS